MDEGIETTRTTVVDGVRVRKTIDAEADETAVVTLAVTAERDEATTVRVVEPALGSIPTDAVELTADDAAEHWRLEDEEPTFEREFDPGESYDVVYRVSGVDADRFDALDVDPVVAPAGAAVDDLVDRGDSDAVRELIAGERDSLATAPAAGGVELAADESPGDSSGEIGADSADGPAAVSAAAAADPDSADAHGEEPSEPPVEIEAETDSEAVDVDADPADVDLDEPSGEPAAADSGAPAADDAIAEGTTPDGDAGFDDPGAEASGSGEMDASLAATPSGGVARALLTELREGNVDDETRAALREELEPGRSQDVRIKHLQSEVAEFSAYVELLDEFVDEHGTFESVFGDLTSLDEDVESVREDLEDVREAVEDVEEVSAEVADLRAEKADLEARVDELAEELEDVDDNLAELDEFRDRISDAFRGTGGTES